MQQVGSEVRAMREKGTTGGSGRIGGHFGSLLMHFVAENEGLSEGGIWG